MVIAKLALTEFSARLAGMTPSPDETVVNTGYGELSVPNSLLSLWNRYGWPEEYVLKGMAEAGSVEAVATRPTYAGSA